jgi:hypothetical protein
MASAIAATPSTVVATPVISLRELAPWLLMALLTAATVLYFVGSEQGATSVFAGTAVHELVHDARHLLGYPCH